METSGALANGDRRRRSPHSLGKLIDWKHQVCVIRIEDLVAGAPHSLGKLIEWKHVESVYEG